MKNTITNPEKELKDIFSYLPRTNEETSKLVMSSVEPQYIVATNFMETAEVYDSFVNPSEDPDKSYDQDKFDEFVENNSHRDVDYAIVSSNDMTILMNELQKAHQLDFKGLDSKELLTLMGRPFDKDYKSTLNHIQCEIYQKVTGGDLFDIYDSFEPKLRSVYDKWVERSNNDTLEYKDLAQFQSEVEELGYTFEYDLGGEPTDLRRLSQEEIKINNQVKSSSMKNQVDDQENGQDPKVSKADRMQQKLDSIAVNDVISVEMPNGFIKGMVTAVNENTFQIDSKANGKEITVPKNETVRKMFPRQVYDVREFYKENTALYGGARNFMTILNKTLEQTKFKNYNGLDFKDKTQLLMGKPTNTVIKGANLKKNEDGSQEINNWEAKLAFDVRTKSVKTNDAYGKQVEVKMPYFKLDSKFKQQELSTKFYGKELSDDEKKALIDDGRKLVVSRTSSAGKDYKLIAEYDKDLNSIVSSRYSKKIEEKITKKLDQDQAKAKAKEQKKQNKQGSKVADTGKVENFMDEFRWLIPKANGSKPAELRAELDKIFNKAFPTIVGDTAKEKSKVMKEAVKENLKQDVPAGTRVTLAAIDGGKGPATLFAEKMEPETFENGKKAKGTVIYGISHAGKEYKGSPQSTLTFSNISAQPGQIMYLTEKTMSKSIQEDKKMKEETTQKQTKTKRRSI